MRVTIVARMIPEILEEYWPLILAITNISLAVGVTLHAVLNKRDTRAIIGWVGLAWLAPLAGSLSYWLFGVNRIRRMAAALHIGEGHAPVEPVLLEADHRARDELLRRLPRLQGLHDLGLNVTGKRLLPGNAVTLLLNGDEAYPAMLEAIEQAEQSVSLLSYIFDVDRAGEQFVDALKSAQARNVEVRVLIDHVGSRYSRPNMVRRLRREGIRVAAFLPTGRPLLTKYTNLRNHRKILVADGRVGFTGGTNIREGHVLGWQPKYPVQCAHFRLEGPVVAHLQEVFAIDWAFTTGEALEGETWFPAAVARSGTVAARGVATGPDEDFEKMSEMMLGAIATAERNIRITSPYFLPDPPILRALNVAAMRGVQVDIVIPQKNNIALVQWATRAEINQVIQKGCRVHLSSPPFDHSKIMVVDGVWSLIGSSNWDPRSLRLNFEFNVECYDTDLASSLEALVDAKIAAGEPLTLETLERRNFAVKLRDGLARLATPYL